MTDKDRRTILWLAEIAAWLQAYRKAQVDYRQRNRLINAAILLQHEQSPFGPFGRLRDRSVSLSNRRDRRPWYHRLWRAKENDPCSS